MRRSIKNAPSIKLVLPLPILHHTITRNSSNHRIDSMAALAHGANVNIVFPQGPAEHLLAWLLGFKGGDCCVVPVLAVVKGHLHKGYLSPFIPISSRIAFNSKLCLVSLNLMFQILFRISNNSVHHTTHDWWVVRPLYLGKVSFINNFIISPLHSRLSFLITNF